MKWVDAKSEKPVQGVEVLMLIRYGYDRGITRFEVGEWDGEFFFEPRECANCNPDMWTYIDYPENEK